MLSSRDYWVPADCQKKFTNTNSRSKNIRPTEPQFSRSYFRLRRDFLANGGFCFGAVLIEGSPQLIRDLRRSFSFNLASFHHPNELAVLKQSNRRGRGLVACEVTTRFFGGFN